MPNPPFPTTPRNLAPLIPFPLVFPFKFAGAALEEASCGGGGSAGSATTATVAGIPLEETL